ncbi:MAG TPA: hypothetical protein VG326_08240 [Tepidisphaeraceae bacterium]|nr:hypothetical protein [Tepidisphaeraceae bacterium]
MRSILLVILSLAILVGSFVVYARYETKGAHAADLSKISVPPPPPPRPGQLKSGVIKEGESPWTEVFDEETGALKNRFRGDEYTPQDDGVILVKNPVAEFFLPNHQKMRLTGTTGEMVMPESPGVMKTSATDPPRGGSPNRGRIHDCKIELFNLFPDSSSQPDETIWMNNAQFDNETMLITTEAYKDGDRMISADQVHVKMRGKKYDFDGRGLRLRWNDKDGRLELLEVAHGEELVIKDASAVSGTLAPGGAKRMPAPQSAQAPAISHSPAPIGVAISRPASVMTADKDRPRDALPPLAVMLAATDKASAVNAARSAPNPPLKTKPPSPPVPYLATFYDNVRIVQGEEALITAERMDVDFTTRKDAPPPAGAPSVTGHESATRPAGATVRPPAQPGVPAPARPQSAAQKSAGKPAATQPGPPPVVIYWTGKLAMFPAKGNRPAAAAGDAIVELTGKPVNIRRSPPAPQEGDAVQAARVVYHTGDGSVKLFNSPSAPKVIINKIVNGKIDPQTTVTTDTLDYAIDANGRKFAVLTGPGHALAPVESSAEKQSKNKKPSDQKMDVRWTRGAKVYFAANGQNDQAVEHMDLAGDVDVKHPQLAMQSQALSLFFEPAPKTPAAVLPVAAGAKPTPKESSQAELKRVFASDAVHCVLAGQNGKKQTIDCSTLEMRTAKAPDGKFYARTVDAEGAVHAYDEDQDLRSGIVLLTLKPAKPPASKAGPTASGAGAAKKIAATQGTADPAEGGAVELEKMIARQDVQVINKEGSRATGSELIVTTSEDGANHVRLTGAPLASVIDAKKNVVTGPLITVDPKTGIAHVIGAGNMHMLQEQTDGSKPRPMDVAWTDRADMDGAQNRMDVLGDVIVKTLDTEGAMNTATGDRVHIDLVKKALPATRPAPRAAAQPAGKDKPANGMQMDVMKDKDARTITITGASAKVKSTLAGSDGVIVRQFVIIGPRIIYQLLDSPELPAKTLWVPSAGQMFMGDHRPPEKPKAGAKKGDEDDTGGRGDTAFKWERQLVYSEARRQAVMTGDVIIVHQPEGKESAQGPVRINADQVTAWFDPIKPDGKPATKPARATSDPQTSMQLKNLTADGHVTITRAASTLTADAVEYDPRTHWMVAHGTDTVDAKYEDSQNTTASKSAHDMAWNTQTWNIKAAGPRLVNPR